MFSKGRNWVYIIMTSATGVAALLDVSDRHRRFLLALALAILFLSFVPWLWSEWQRLERKSYYQAAPLIWLGAALTACYRVRRVAAWEPPHPALASAFL